MPLVNNQPYGECSFALYRNARCRESDRARHAAMSTEEWEAAHQLRRDRHVAMTPEQREVQCQRNLQQQARHQQQANNNSSQSMSSYLT